MPRSQQEKDKTKLAFAMRLHECLVQTGRSHSPTQLAIEFNAHFSGPKISMHSCRKWLQAESIPTQEKIVVLARMLGASPEWLRYGQTSQILEAQASHSFNRAELSLVAGFQKLERRDQRLLMQLIKIMLKTLD